MQKKVRDPKKSPYKLRVSRREHEAAEAAKQEKSPPAESPSQGPVLAKPQTIQSFACLILHGNLDDPAVLTIQGVTPGWPYTVPYYSASSELVSQEHFCELAMKKVKQKVFDWMEKTPFTDSPKIQMYLTRKQMMDGDKSQHFWCVAVCRNDREPKLAVPFRTKKARKEVCPVWAKLEPSLIKKMLLGHVPIFHHTKDELRRLLPNRGDLLDQVNKVVFEIIHRDLGG